MEFQTLTSNPDGIVIQAVLDGQRERYRSIVERYEDRITALCLSLTGNPQEAAELGQEAFVQAYQHLQSYDTSRPFFPWIAAITYRLSHKRWRSRARETDIRKQFAEEELVSTTGADVLAQMVRGETARHLWREVSRLSKGERVTTLLYYRSELSIADTARIMGVSTGTVKTFLFRARQHLRNAMSHSQATEKRDYP